jgi:LmbE family N-acetylglucosaminyl deacetylase
MLNFVKKLLRDTRVVLTLCLAVLFATTIYWAVLGAIVQNNNADQLIDPLLFSNVHTFQGAVFPAAHTFLLKWPLFALIAVFNNSAVAIVLVTVLLCVATIAGFFYLIYRAEKRPLVLALMALFLASMLLMTPVEPHPGALLPTNFAMLTTRNIEYIFFVFSIILLTKPRKSYIAGALSLLTILFASDRLFMMLGLGASALSLGVYYLLGHRRQLSTLIRILVVMLASAALSYGLIALINITGLTHISSGASIPYATGFDLKEKLQAVFYATSGTATNFGANPLYDLASWKDTLSILLQRAISWTSFAYLVNIIGVILVALCGIKLVQLSRNKKRRKLKDKSDTYLLSLLFGSAALVAIALFIISDHYYPVDARYLAVSLPAGMVIVAACCAMLWKAPRIKPWMWAVLSVSILCGIGSTHMQYQASLHAYQDDTSANETIRGALAQHPVKTLIGDYWRSVPVVSGMTGNTNVDPLGACFSPRDSLTSSHWTKGETNQSFAYLLSTKQTSTGFPACSLQDVQDAYGRPSRTTITKGQLPAPSEMLLFYDYGKRPQTVKKPAVIVRAIDALDSKPCQNNTVMQIVAHQDDDLLFMNPDLIHSIKQGECIRTVYMTAGDGGHQKPYWISREDGAMAAYATALGVSNPHWTISPYRISETAYISVARLLESGGQVSLIFLRLPDGNMDGAGFAQEHNESLARFYDGRISTIHSVDGQSRYTKNQLVTTLSFLMKKYTPEQVRIQATSDHGQRFHDHSDHINSGKFATLAYDSYKLGSPASSLTQYIGYPIHEDTPNVSGPDLALKSAMFYAYGKHDKATCTSEVTCANTAYRSYLPGQYPLR